LPGSLVTVTSPGATQFALQFLDKGGLYAVHGD
jgi:hypothetical protein